MRPQDIVILLKIVALKDEPWQNKDLARYLMISASEISESLYRSAVAGLIDADQRKRVYRQSLVEFLEHGLHYVFPAQPASMTNGMYTAHSHTVMQKKFANDSNVYVWPDPKGKVRGLSIEPLYKGQVEAAKKDQTLYLMLCMVDVIRVGRVREVKFAVEQLQELILA